MTTPNQQLTTTPAPGSIISTLDDMERVAKLISGNGMFGITIPGQAIGLFLLCQAEGINPVLALRRYHIIEGKPSMRSDAMQGEFEAKGGGIFWHVRTDKMVVATFYRDRKTMSDPKAIERARLRAAAMIDGDEKTVMEQSHPDEDTIVRTLADAVEKGIATTYEKIDGKITKNPDGTFKKALKSNWAKSTRQMLTARCITEGVRLMNPGLIAGIVSEDEARDIAEQAMQTVHSLADENPPSQEIVLTREYLESAIPVRQALAEQKTKEWRESTDPKEKARLLNERSAIQDDLYEMEKALEKLNTGSAQPKTIEAHAEIVTENKEPEPQPATNPLPGPHPKAEPPPTDWRTVDFSSRNLKTGNPLYGKTVGEVFDTGSIELASRILPSLRKNFIEPMDAAVKAYEEGTHGAPAPRDMELYLALLEGEKRLAERIAEAK